MTMRLEVNGVLYERFTEATVDIRLDALSNSFSFAAVGDELDPIPFSLGDECRVFVDDHAVLDGHVELLNVDGDSTSHDLAVAGRDRTGDLLDSTLGVLDDLLPPISLKRLCERVVAHLTPTESERIGVVDDVAPALFNVAEDKIAPEPGENAFDFLEKWARKRAVILTSNFQGDLVIADPSGTEIEAWVHHRKDNALDNNVVAYSMSYDDTGRYNLYRSQAELNPNATVLAGLASHAPIVDQSGEAVDSLIREGRQLVLVSESAFSNAQNRDRARWERNVRLARGRLFSATMAGYTNQTGDLWRVNTLPWVISEMAGINTRMLVNSVRFSKTLELGEQTVLGFVERDAYTRDLAEPTVESEERSGLGGLSG